MSFCVLALTSATEARRSPLSPLVTRSSVFFEGPSFFRAYSMLGKGNPISRLVSSPTPIALIEDSSPALSRFFSFLATPHSDRFPSHKFFLLFALRLLRNSLPSYFYSWLACATIVKRVLQNLNPTCEEGFLLPVFL